MEREKRTRGRQKVEIKKIEDEDDRYATFSKRREGVYKKARELCILCNTDVGIVIFSSTGKVYSFGHPTIESNINRFLKQNLSQSDSASLVEAHLRNRIVELNERNNEMIDRWDSVKENGKKLDAMIGSRQRKTLWEKHIDQLTREQALSLIATLEDINTKMTSRLLNVLNPGYFGAAPSDAAGPSHGHGTINF